MKRSPLKRKTSLRSEAAKRAKLKSERFGIPRKKRKPRGDADDPKYLEFVRTLPCCAPKLFHIAGAGLNYAYPARVERCGRRSVQAHHLTGAGMAQKARDDQTMPLCADDHRGLHEFSGPFYLWTREERYAWQLEQIENTRKAYARHQEDARR